MSKTYFIKIMWTLNSFSSDCGQSVFEFNVVFVSNAKLNDINLKSRPIVRLKNWF